MHKHQIYINGEYVDSTSPKTIDIENPATEQVISQISEGSEEDADNAVQAAFRAQKEWGQTPSVERGEIVRDIGLKLKENRENFIDILIEEQGKSYEMASGEVDLAIDYFQYMSEWARRIEGEILPSDRPNENIFIHKRPIGVVAGIIPWNFPVFILARKVATSLVAGCTIVIKPSQQTPNTAAAFTKMVHDMDILPKGVYNFITGKGSTIGNVLASHEKVDMVTMTGSIPAGVKVMEAAAQNITKVNLELGGKAPAIVTKYADLDLAVKNISKSRIINAGQACTNAERVYVHEDVADDFISRLTKEMSEVTYGDPKQDDSLDMGPLVSGDRLEEVDEMVKGAVNEGAEIATGGERASGERGYFYKPTVLTNVSHNMKVIQEEIFGPVLPVVVYKDINEAIDMANDSDYGLSSSIYTENYHEAMKLTNGLRFGETFVNRENFEAVQGYHAGFRKSGIGGADGKHGLEDFLSTQTVYMEFKNSI
ncbi:aldehyde dehydrogenase [Salipaludibacillus aurantiacus]|uniref:3-sulfolactaldehyde dehydrogenase n=1 Tax=Salipaludibacillus aurantiacus TaxID=1601833 RepID=A0A1H9NV04_9BACI|nr:aldehyde dehydrogenase [Salipaludibacillus aurantiacus]SER39874.1 lactaldehyde dehydrogenase / glycolaldehyde dehydrogenase [Salipaludibacillus aurantiacus]